MHICNSGLGAAKLLQSTLLQTVDRPRVRQRRLLQSTQATTNRKSTTAGLCEFYANIWCT